MNGGERHRSPWSPLWCQEEPPLTVAQAEVLVFLGSLWWNQENLPVNPLALIVAGVETPGTPFWPKKISPLTPLGHLSHMQFLWEGLVAKPAKRCNLCDKCMEMPLPLSSRVAWLPSRLLMHPIDVRKTSHFSSASTRLKVNMHHAGCVDCITEGSRRKVWYPPSVLTSLAAFGSVSNRPFLWRIQHSTNSKWVLASSKMPWLHQAEPTRPQFEQERARRTQCDYVQRMLEQPHQVPVIGLICPAKGHLSSSCSNGLQRGC